MKADTSPSHSSLLPQSLALHLAQRAGSVKVDGWMRLMGMSKWMDGWMSEADGDEQMDGWVRLNGGEQMDGWVRLNGGG